MLLNPAIEQNKLVQLDNASIQQSAVGIDKQSQVMLGGSVDGKHEGLRPSLSADGKYKVLYVTHTGDTRGNDWFTDIVCFAGEFISNVDTQGKYLPYQPYQY